MLIEEFHDYLIGLDPLHRLRRLPAYGSHEMKKILKDVRTKRGKLIVALDENNIVGFISGVILIQPNEELLHIVPTKAGRITDVYVDSSYRGLGIGSSFIKHMETILKKWDVIRYL